MNEGNGVRVLRYRIIVTALCNASALFSQLLHQIEPLQTSFAKFHYSNHHPRKSFNVTFLTHINELTLHF